MKAINASILSASALLFAGVAVTTIGSASEEHGSAMQIQGRSLTAWVADVDAHPGQHNPALDVLVSTGPKVIANLANVLLHESSTSERAGAALAIGAIACHNPAAPELASAVPALALAAENIDLRLRVVAIQGLGAVGRPASNTIPLLVRSTKYEDMSVRLCAMEALGRIGVATPQAVDALKSGMSDPSGDVRITAVQAFYKIGQPATNTIPVLVQLTKDESVGVRCAAVETLGRVGANSPEAVAALQSALHDTSEDAVRPLARKALKVLEASRK